jgi:hypothetical protein
VEPPDGGVLYGRMSMVCGPAVTSNEEGGGTSGFALPRSALHDSRRVINYSCALPRFFPGFWCDAHQRRSAYEPINAPLLYLHQCGPAIDGQWRRDVRFAII